MNDKTNIILNSFSKIRHKRWELYCLTRMINRLNDLEIEFKCQQLIRTAGGVKLVDIYFPQINLYVEVNEPHHSSDHSKNYDKQRDRDISEAIAAHREDIDIVTNENDKEPLESLNARIEQITETIRNKVEQARKNGTFIPWSEKLENQYNHEHRSHLDVADNVDVRKQVDAINLFGFNFKGHQRGAWRFPDKNKKIWFPRFYEHKEWTNELSPDGETITEKMTAGSIIEYKMDVDFIRIVFGRYRDQLGHQIYKYTGEFKYSHEEDNGRARIYKRVSTRTPLPKK